MRSIVTTCQPRSDTLTGSFNPEIFTASLSQVMDCYRGRATPTSTLYTDAEHFFRDATYPTEGLSMALAEVFGRLAGDNSVPAIHRLETAFGGGKTHTLIALTHLGFRGQELAAMTRAEHQHTLAVPRIEAINQAAGRSQECLAYLVIRAIIQARQRTGGAEPLLWPEIDALEDMFQEKDRIRVRRLPSDQVRHLSGLLFTPTMPTTGDVSYLDAPSPLLMASLDAAYRVAKGMKVKRAELSTADFLARLSRELVRVAQ